MSEPKSVWWRKLTTEQLREYPHASCGLSDPHNGHGWRGVRREFGGAAEVYRTLWCEGRSVNEQERRGPVNEAAFDRTRDFILAAAESGREPAADWRDALHDVALELDKLAHAELAHPDSVDSAALAMSSLSGVWLDDDEKGALYLGALDQRDSQEGASGE